MKKPLIIGVLVLLIVSSMVAGTLAVYSNSIDLGGDAAAKRFFIGADADTDTAQLKLAPTESDDYKFVVTNKRDNTVTEVAMDLTIVATIPESFGDVDVALTLGGDTIPGIVADGKATFAIENWSEANEPKTERATLTYTWNDAENQLEKENVTQSFTVTVIGTQHIG